MMLKSRTVAVRIKGITIASLILLVPLQQPAADGPSCEVPLHHPVYRYLAMLPLPPRVGDISLANRPFTEAQVCSLITYAGRNRLVPDTSLGRFYMRQFSRTADGRPVQPFPATLKFDDFRTSAYPYAINSFNVQDSNFSPAGFNALKVDSVSRATETYNTTAVGLRMRSSYKNILLYFDGSINTEYSTLRKWEKAFDPHAGVFQTPIMTENAEPGHFMGYDEFTAYLKMRLPWFDLKAGNDHVSWGYGDTAGLLFSGAGKPFLHLKADGAIGKLNYTFLYGRLTGDTFQERRVIYAKRTTYTPWPWLSLALSDAVITVNRDFEPLYCFPVLPFYFTEHFLGDQDNRIMSFDILSLIRKRVALYGELFLDDISNLLGMFSNKSWGDKWGALAGVTVIDPLPFLPASMIRGQYSQLEPWVYTTSARVGGTANNYPVNFGRPLGSQRGPHSRSLVFDFSGQYNSRIGADIGYRRFWKGRGAGSSLFDRNEVVLDTINGTIVPVREHETKEYRFAEFDRDRSVFSASINIWCATWMRLVVNGDFAVENEPVRTGLFHTGLELQIQY
jgi:hypothetical protein